MELAVGVSGWPGVLGIVFGVRRAACAVAPAALCAGSIVLLCVCALHDGRAAFATCLIRSDRREVVIVSIFAVNLRVVFDACKSQLKAKSSEILVYK